MVNMTLRKSKLTLKSCVQILKTKPMRFFKLIVNIESLRNLEVIECMKNIDIDLRELIELKYFTLKFGFLTREKSKTYFTELR